MNLEQKKLKNILDRVTANDIEVEIMTKEIAELSPVDYKMKNEIRNLISKFNNDSAKLLQLHHNMSQDLTLRNEEIKTRINLMINKLTSDSKDSNAEGEVMKFIEGFKRLAEGVDVDGNEVIKEE